MKEVGNVSEIIVTDGFINEQPVHFNKNTLIFSVKIEHEGKLHILEAKSFDALKKKVRKLGGEKIEKAMVVSWSPEAFDASRRLRVVDAVKRGRYFYEITETGRRVRVPPSYIYE